MISHTPIDQRTSRKMFMATEDKELARKQERILRRREQEAARRQRSVSASTSTASQPSDLPIDDTVDTENSDESDAEFEPPKLTSTTSETQQRWNTARSTTCQLFTPHVTSALDRNKTSDREALRLIVPIAAALGHDPATLPLSRSSFQRVWKKAWKEYVESAMVTFAPEYPLVLGWEDPPQDIWQWPS